MTQLDLAALATPCQRWHARRCSWRSGDVIDPGAYGVELMQGDAAARAFVERHHYSGSYPAARARVGLYRSRGPWLAPELVGVAVFSVPMNQRVIPAYFPGMEPSEGVELGRFVLLDDVAANGETWFLSRALAALRDALPGVRGVLSYSDPVPRRSSAGGVIMPGHVGTIYQAHNAHYHGRATARTLWLDARGRCLSGRTISKVRGEESGVDYACAQVARATGVERTRYESGADYIARALASGALTRLRHPGNHAYTWALDRKLRRAHRANPATYPKEVDR